MYHSHTFKLADAINRQEVESAVRKLLDMELPKPKTTDDEPPFARAFALNRANPVENEIVSYFSECIISRAKVIIMMNSIDRLG